MWSLLSHYKEGHNHSFQCNDTCFVNSSTHVIVRYFLKFKDEDSESELENEENGEK